MSDTKTVATTEKKSAAAALKGKAKAETAKPSAKDALKKGKAKAEEVKAEAPKVEEVAEPTFETSKTYTSLVTTQAPKNEGEAKAKIVDIEASVNAENMARYKLGLDWLIMRAQRPNLSEDEVKSLATLERGICSRKLANGTVVAYNGFGLAGYENEGQAAVALGLATARTDAKGKVIGYNLNRVSQAVTGAKLHLKLIEAGVEAGIGVFDKGTAGILMRSSEKVVDEIVPIVAGGATQEQVREAVEKSVGATSKRRIANLKAEKIKTPDLKGKVAKLFTKISKALVRIETEGKAAHAFWKELMKRTDLKEADHISYDARLGEVQTAAVNVVKALGLEEA